MASKLRIALVAPLAESVPPKTYGGTERVVSYLTEELVGLGHHVTLFASGDSRTDAELVEGAPGALRLDDRVEDPLVWHMLMLERLYERIEEFDIIHGHLHYLPYSMMRRLGKPMVTTVHGRMDFDEYEPLYEEFSEAPLVSISYSQRRPLPMANWVDTVYHGLPADAYRLQAGGDYLAFLGRVSPEKGIESAIEVADRTEMPLKIAAKVGRRDRAYFEDQIRPHIDGRRIEFVGEIGEERKRSFLGRAAALLFLVEWPEPFGLAMVEAMACGTPVIARRRGSIPEVVDHGISGFVCEDVDEAVDAVERLDALDPESVREAFERRFSARRMARDYAALYREVMLDHQVSALSRLGPSFPDRDRPDDTDSPGGSPHRRR